MRISRRAAIGGLVAIGASGRGAASSHSVPGGASTTADLALGDRGSFGIEGGFHAALAAPTGSALIGTIHSGVAAVPRSLQDILREGPRPVTAYGARSDGTNATAAFADAFEDLSKARTHPAGRQAYGVGTIAVPKGQFDLDTPLVFSGSQLGFRLAGDAVYATTIRKDIATGYGISLAIYVGASLSDFFLKNVSADPGDSIGILLDGAGGGGMLDIKRVTIEGFHTGIGIAGTVNGDKSLYENVSIFTPMGWTNNANKQAVGHTFVQCEFRCEKAAIEYGGAGELSLYGSTALVRDSFVTLREGAGNPGSLALPGRILADHLKMEYHHEGAERGLILDATACLVPTNAGGAGMDIVFRNCALAGGKVPVSADDHLVIKVGDGESGNDAIRFQQIGGHIAGTVEYTSSNPAVVNRRWSFRYAQVTPLPTKVVFSGVGGAPLMEWRHNENVPVDQYRGGQTAIASVDKEKTLLWRSIGKNLLNSGVADQQTAFGARFGKNHVVNILPPYTTVTGLWVFLDENLGAATDLEVTSYRNGGFTSPLGPTLAIAARSGRGWYKVHDEFIRTGPNGAVYVRITTNGTGRAVDGALGIHYHPYMGGVAL